MNTTSFGFRVLGSPLGERRLVDWLDAFTGYACLDVRAEVERESYLSAFTFGADFRQHLKTTGTTKKFGGICGASWLWMDIDREDLETATRDARRLAASLVDRYGLDGDDLLLFFSGRKGYHLGLPMSVCGSPAPSLDFHRVARRFAEGLAERAGVVIDTGVYDKVRLFRAPNSRHPKTGLYKHRLTFEGLLRLKIQAILGMAATAEAFEIPEPPPPSSQAVEDWQDAVTETARAATVGRARQEGGGRLNRATLEFIREGAATGERASALFSAAANLAEFGCPPALAHALLTEAGLDSGLTPSEVRRQIDCGIEHGKNYQEG